VCMEDEAFQSMVTDELNGLFFKTQNEYEKQILFLYDNPSELERLDRQARIQAETYSSKYYGERVLEVYNRAIQDKAKETRFGFLSLIVNKIKEVFK